jgi:hypothetical protein
MTNTNDLRRYLCRLLGWTNTSAIENALRSLDLAREHRAQLVLCGAGDLVPIAYGLHRRALGPDTPFIVCDPRRGNTPATVRAPANYVDVDAAFAAAAVGRSACAVGDCRAISTPSSNACARAARCNTSASRSPRYSGSCARAPSRSHRSSSGATTSRRSSTSACSTPCPSLPGSLHSPSRIAHG